MRQAKTTTLHVSTPLTWSQPLSKLAGFDVYLKLDNLQPTSTFKDRGVGNLCKKAHRAGGRHIVCSSGGNAGLAASNAARQLGIKSTICVPETTPLFTVEKLKDYGAEVEIVGKVWDETDIRAREIASKPGYTYVSPFNHPDIWEGHSTIIEEILHQLDGERPDVVIVSVGGGGLLCGVMEGLIKVNWETVPVIAMETFGAESLNASIKAGKVVTLPGITSVAKSLGSKRVCDKAFEYSQKYGVISHVVSDEEAISACLRFADDHRFLVEPACGASLAAVYSSVIKRLQSEDRLGQVDKAVVIVCGGNSVTLQLLAKWKEQFKV